MTIARQLYLLVCLPPLLAIAFGLALTYQYAGLSARGSHLLQNLRRTAEISRRLAMGNVEQSRLVSDLFEGLSADFPERLRHLDYRMGEHCTEYLRLDIGVEERLAVERIKTLQSELSVLALRIYHDLQNNADRHAAFTLTRAHRLEGQAHDEFEKLNQVQLETLRSVLVNLDDAARQGMIAVGAMVGALLLAAGATAFVIRRRILKPVRTLAAASEQIRLGNLSARAASGHDDEMGRLTRDFNYMADSLSRSYGDLERKVHERTAELKEVQGQLLQAEKLSALGLLVGGVAHELNNPLTAIVGFNQLARMEAAAAPGTQPLTQLLDEVEAQTERCRRLISTLLQFARKQEPRLEPFEINAAVEQMLELRAYELSTRNMRLVREYDPANPVLCADRDKVQQVVLNLLNNAADAIAATGRAGTIVVKTRRESDRVVLEFVDDGAGFRDPARAFDPFYTTKEVGKGTGLGLSVCYGIVHEHGGDISAGNWENGARVVVVLPATGTPRPLPGTAVEAPPPPLAQPAGSVGRRVLVVDDEEPLLRLQVAFLRKMGLDAVLATSGEEAIRHLQEHDVDLIVSDVRMPGMDGVDLFEWVRSHRPELRRRFVFASGDLVGLNLDEYFERAGAARINKPFSFGAYVETVRRVLDEGSV